MYTSEFLRITQETTFGTYNSSPTTGQVAIVQLDQANAFTMRPKPMRWSIRTASSNNRRVQTGSSKMGYQGGLQTLIYPSQAGLLLPWFCNLDATTGQAYSCTIDHAITMEDSGATVVYKRYLGCKVGRGVISGNADDQLMRLRLDLIGQTQATITNTDFPTPALTDYPTDAPYVFEHLAGGLTLNGSLPEPKSFELTVENILDATFNSSAYVTRIKNCGRNVDFVTAAVYQRATDRTKFEGVTAITAEAVFTNGAHSLTFNMETQNFYDDINDDLPFDKVKYQELHMQAYLDGTAGNDFSLTIA
jgi:hypothetical protein